MLLPPALLLLVAVLPPAQVNGHLHRSNYRRFRPSYDARPETATVTNKVYPLVRTGNNAFTELVTPLSSAPTSSSTMRTPSEPKHPTVSPSVYPGSIVANQPHRHSQYGRPPSMGLGDGQAFAHQLDKSLENTAQTEPENPEVHKFAFAGKNNTLVSDFPNGGSQWALKVYGPYGGPAFLNTTGNCSKSSPSTVLQ
jgi:hypothetical protein